jgi:fumarate hydratase subunit beta
MDPFTIPLLEAGLRGAIGKGGRSPEVREAFARHGAVYFLAIGGAGALISKHIVRAETVAWEELGPEAVRRLWLRDFPVIVGNDIYGGDALEEGKRRWRREEARPPARSNE